MLARISTQPRRTCTLQISAERPFDFSKSTSFLEEFPPTRGDQAIVGGRLLKAWQFGEVTIASDIIQRADGPVEVVFTSHAPITRDLQIEATRRISFFLSLSDEIGSFYRAAESDPKMLRVVDRGFGFHQVKIASATEHVCWLILAHGKPLSLARRMRCAIESHFGNRIEVANEKLSAFPSLAQLVSLDENEIRILTGNARKSGYLFRSMRQLATVDDEFLRDAPIGEVRRFVAGLPGIGSLAATFLIERSLGRMEQLSAHPEALRDASRTYGRPIGEVEFHRLARRYGPWSRYWLLYMRAFADRTDSPR